MFSKITRKNLDNFLKKYASDERVLDIGSGGSGYGKYFPNRLTVDIDPDRKPEIVADAHNLPFKDGEFGFVLCTEVLEHVKDPKTVISEINRVLKTGGKLVLTTRFMHPIHDAPDDFWRFTRFGMLELFKDWDVIELVPETETFSSIAAILQRICFQTELRLNKISKFIIFSVAFVVNKLNFLLVKEYGDIKKTYKVENIMSTGYYVIAKKK